MIEKIKNNLIYNSDKEDLELGLLTVISGDPLSGKTTLLRQLKEESLIYLPYDRSAICLDAIRDFDGCDRPKQLSDAPYSIKYEWIIKTALSIAEPGDTIVVENPELHLHPKTASKIGELFAEAANGCIQVILETNSEAIMNAISKACVKSIISPSYIRLHHIEMWFNTKINNYKTIVHSPRIYSNGGFSKTPSGFFDQTYTDAWELISLPRGQKK